MVQHCFTGFVQRMFNHNKVYGKSYSIYCTKHFDIMDRLSVSYRPYELQTVNDGPDFCPSSVLCSVVSKQLRKKVNKYLSKSLFTFELVVWRSG